MFGRGGMLCVVLRCWGAMFLVSLDFRLGRPRLNGPEVGGTEQDVENWPEKGGDGLPHVLINHVLIGIHSETLDAVPCQTLEVG